MAEDTQLHIEKWQRLLVIVSTMLVLLVFVVAVVRLGEFIHHTLLLFAIGGLLAYAFDPVVEGLRRLVGSRASGKIQLPRSYSISIVYISFLLILGFGVYGLSRPLRIEIKLLTDSTQQTRTLSDSERRSMYHERERAYLQELDTSLGNAGIHSNFASYVDDPNNIPQGVKDAWTATVQKVPEVIGDIAEGVGSSVFVLLISLYLLIFAHDLRDRLNAALPPNILNHVYLWQEDVNRILGGFVRGQLTLGLILGSAAAIGCLAIGIHIWLLIGIFVAVAALIPVFGPYLGAAPAIIASLVTPTHFENPMVAVIVVIALFVLINEIGSKIIYPRLVGQAIGLHEVLVLFAIFAGLEIDGIVGVLFAAPLTAIIGVTVVHLYRLWQDLPDSLLSSRDPNRAAQPGDALLDVHPTKPSTDEKPTAPATKPKSAPGRAKAPTG